LKLLRGGQWLRRSEQFLPLQSFLPPGQTGSRRFIFVSETDARSEFEPRSSTLNRREWERSVDKAHERPVVTEANKEAVRAGHTGDHLRYVLFASCALVIIAFIAIALFVRP
jgi:hypothetical protein